MDIHSEFADGEEPLGSEKGDDSDSEVEVDEEGTTPKKGDPFIHQHDAQITLSEDSDTSRFCRMR